MIRPCHRRLASSLPRPIIEGVGDRDAGACVITFARRLAVGMISPDEIAPARRKLIRRHRTGKTELGGDFGWRIREIGRRFVRRSGRLPSQPIRRLVRPLQSQAETRLSAGTRRGAKFEARADARPPAGPDPSSSSARSCRRASSRAR